MTSAIYLVIGCVVAFAAYRESDRFEKANGVTPWHWPSWVWAVVGFFSFVLVALLLYLARRNTKPLQANGYPPITSGDSFVANQAPSTTGFVPPPVAPPMGASWQQDPTGRYASRYWDGASWTPYVSDGSSTTSDPLPV